MIAANLKQTARDTRLNIPDIIYEDTRLPALPEIPKASQISKAPKIKEKEVPPPKVPIDVITNQLNTTIIPSFGPLLIFFSGDEVTQITSESFISQKFGVDEYGGLTLMQKAFHPIDSPSIIAQSAYRLDVSLYWQDGSVLNQGAGKLLLNLSDRSLMYSSLHELGSDLRLGLDAKGVFDDGPFAGSLESSMRLDMQISGSAAQSADAQLSALTARDQIIGSLITLEPNPHFTIVGFKSAQ